MQNKITGRIRLGPATLVSAAFIGPGTVITCSLAGANFGYALLWALLLSILTTIFLQDMAGRLAIGTKTSLAEAIRVHFTGKWAGFLIFPLVIGAIGVGNAAYQSGNMTGAAMGLDAIALALSLPRVPLEFYLLGISGLIFILLYIGRYKLIERLFIGIIVLMSLLFLITLFFIDINWSMLFSGLFIPGTDSSGFYTVMGLIGTTVVPYNLFLHSNAVRDRGWTREDVPAFRFDLLVSILLGGMISMSILITAAVAQLNDPSNLLDLSLQLTPILGDYASAFFAIGIFAAGLTSSLTSPMAAAYTVCGILGQAPAFSSRYFRISWMIVLVAGVIVSLTDMQPLFIIQAAQFMNGLLLPVIAVLLVIMTNQPAMGALKNSKTQNLIAVAFIIIVIGLGLKSILSTL